MTETIVVTGSAGLIGSSVVSLAKTRSYNIYTIDVVPSTKTDSHFHLTADLSLSGSELALGAFLSNINTPFSVLHCAGIDVKVPDQASSNSTPSIDNRSPLREPVEDFCRNVSNNISMTYRVLTTSVDRMIKIGGGSIFLLGSVYGDVAPDQRLYMNPDGSSFMNKSFSYPIAKSTFPMFSKLVASNFAQYNIRCNNVALHAIVNNPSQIFERNFMDLSPTKSFSDLASVSEFLLYLMISSPSFLNGSTILLDGGWTSR